MENKKIKTKAINKNLNKRYLSLNKDKIKLNLNIFKIFSIILFISLLLNSVNAEINNSNQNSHPNISISLMSNKLIYNVGENINLSLKIKNNYNEDIPGQLKGKVIIGDVGYEIQCFDYSAPANKSEILGLSPIPATLSNSNRKTMTTLYACSGTQMQSTKTIMDNKPISQNGDENFLVGPFKFDFTYNGTDYEIKSNILNITVKTNNQQQSQQNSNNQNQGNKNSQSQSQNSQNSQNGGQNSQSQSQSKNIQNQQSQNQNLQNPQNTLSNKNQQALTNNQKNFQSVNQLKKDIAKAKLNPFIKENENNFWYWFLLLVLIIGISLYIFNKYLKKEIKEEKTEIETELKKPKYELLLNSINNENDFKENVKILSQAIRNYISSRNGLNEDLSYSKAIELSKDKKLIELLKKCERIEFAQEKEKIQFEEEIKNLKKDWGIT